MGAPTVPELEDDRWDAVEDALRAVPRAGAPAGLRERCLPGTAVPGGQERRFRILVVDDEPAIRRLVEANLSRAGYEVALARDGAEALAAVMAKPPDLVVLDVLMPGMSGLGVLGRLKSDPRTWEIPVVMLTAQGHDDQIRHGWQSGTDFYMTQPFNPEELRSVIDRITAVLGTPDNPPPLRRGLK